MLEKYKYAVIDKKPLVSRGGQDELTGCALTVYRGGVSNGRESKLSR